MQLTELMMAAAITASVAGVAYAELSPGEMSSPAHRVAETATCRTVKTAVVAYESLNERPPTAITDLTALVDGDIAAYRLVDGAPAGPGC